MNTLFKDLTPASVVYALVKGDVIKYCEGSIVTVGKPRMNMPEMKPGQLQMPTMQQVVDVTYSIDGKNRVIIPAKYRDALGKECIVTKGLDDCLEVYPMQAWADEEARYATLPRTDVEARALLRYRSGNAENCELDKQGRMVIPQFLREEAGIEKDLVTIGVLDHLEIWAKEVYDAAKTGGLMKSDDFVGMSGKFPI